MLSDISEDTIRRRLTAAQAQPNQAALPPYFQGLSYQPAAVLIPFLKERNDWHLLFIRRSAHDGDQHSGQVAFPGGRSDPDDPTPEAVALRETYEEVGVAPRDVRVLGKLDRLPTVTGYCVTPVVGIIPWPYALKPSPEEVSRCFTIPLAWLADPNHRVVRARALPPPYEPIKSVYFDPYDGEVLWGLSAQITVNLLNLLYD